MAASPQHMAARMETPSLIPSAADRDMERYQTSYLAASFEPTQAELRKRVVLTTLRTWQARRILEVGCGMAPLFTVYPGFEQMTIVEPGARFAAHARELAGDDGRIQIIEALLEHAATQAPLSDMRFDAILVSGLLHEIPAPLTLLRALRPLCTPTTRLHVNVPNARSLHRLLALEMGLIDDLYALSDRQRTLQQHTTFDLQSLVDLCHAAGYDIVGQGSYFIKPFTHRQMQTLMDVGVMDDRMLDGLMGLEKHLPGLGSEIYLNLKPADRPGFG